MMFHKQLAQHRRNRNLLLSAGWALLLAGSVLSVIWVAVAGGLLLNGYAWNLMRVDKHLAPRRGFRIPEASLLLVAFLGGGIGALAGMLGYHHKTKHARFLILVPLFCMLQVVLLIWLKG
ncbi:DUF1294 domain-containing protein [Brevibacillus reuszeri]|uniref:DUF1294 domain-containing protein n=1 Tax=Brevibacillus reuszeri TaxID=54915 RepID=UPI0028978B4A|nr:DUF1294 domain-containing protein [Brevibacillus reuszeri]